MENAKFFNLDKRVEEFIDLLDEHNRTRKGYRIKTDNLEVMARYGVLYYEDGKSYIFWGEMGKKQDEKIPVHISTPMYDTSKIEAIQEVKNNDDCFSCPLSKIFNIYLFSENDNNDGHRNIVTVGFME